MQRQQSLLPSKSYQNLQRESKFYVHINISLWFLSFLNSKTHYQKHTCPVFSMSRKLVLKNRQTIGKRTIFFSQHVTPRAFNFQCLTSYTTLQYRKHSDRDILSSRKKNIQRRDALYIYLCVTIFTSRYQKGGVILVAYYASLSIYVVYLISTQCSQEEMHRSTAKMQIKQHVEYSKLQTLKCATIRVWQISVKTHVDSVVRLLILHRINIFHFMYLKILLVFVTEKELLRLQIQLHVQ